MFAQRIQLVAVPFFILPVLSLASLCLLTGCDSGIRGSGVSKTETRELPEFKSITLAAVGAVEIVVGDEQSLSITFDDNLIDLVETTVTDGELKISLAKGFNSNLGLRISIIVPAVERLAVSGVGSIDIKELDATDLAIQISGVGSVNAAGAAEKLDVTVSGVGNANLERLKAETVNVRVSGTGNATVFASEKVDAHTSGIGNITVFGNPTLHVTKSTGIGKVTIKD